MEVNSSTFTPPNFTHFRDNTSGYEITPTLTLRQMIFGDGTNETLIGGTGGDHFYGGSGDDQLHGLENSDYLEGNRGDDTLDGGTGADTMLGGSGNDIYIVDNTGDVVREYANSGIDLVRSSVTFTLDSQVENLTLTGTTDIDGTGNELDNTITGNGGINRLDGKGGTDHLIGGDRNDILIGGTGTTISSKAAQGSIRTSTTRATARIGSKILMRSGQIIFNGHRLLGGIHDPNDPLNTYKSLDGLTTYVLSGTDLIVNGVLTVNENFQSGQFGIQLDDLSSLPTNTGVPTGPFLGVFIGTENGEALGRLTGNGVLGDAIYGLGGNDALWGLLIEDDLLDGGSGDDVLVGFNGNDYLDGGVGDDFLYAGGGKDILLGGAGNDFLNGDDSVAGTDDRDYLDGGEGADSLWGGWGTDVLLGGDGDDILRGDNRPDGWLTNTVATGTESDFIPFPGQAIFSATGAADFLDGGSGNDLLVGDGGDDILSGGAGNDQLFGDDEVGYRVLPGNDMLDGGEGDDLLAGGDGNDSLSGGTGLDQLFGDKGDDCSMAAMMPIHCMAVMELTRFSAVPATISSSAMG